MIQFQVRIALQDEKLNVTIDLLSREDATPLERRIAEDMQTLVETTLTDSIQTAGGRLVNKQVVEPYEEAK